jgi:hypothetical protein
MVQPVNHDFGSETATTVLGGLKGGLFYGILGTIASTVAAAAVGALALGGAAALLEFIIPGSWAAPLAAKVGMYAGAVGGFVYGGAASVLGGGIVGMFQGRTQVAREQGLANAIEREKSGAQTQVIANARGDAIEQGVTMGYMQGMQDAQAAMMNQMAAQQQQMQAAHAQEHDCAPCKKAKEIIAKHESKQHGSYAEKVTANAAEPSLGQAV